MFRLLLLALLALPLAAEPMFNLYDCKGKEAVCQSLFPGQRAERDGPFVVNDRVVVNGVDLGAAWNGIRDGYTYVVKYYRHPYVIGWEMFNTDGDEDGHLKVWNLDDPTDVIGFFYIGGNGPGAITDVNSSGQFIGNTDE